MPELPEVETVVRGLQGLRGSSLVPVSVRTTDRYAHYVQAHGVVRDVSRAGKWAVLWIGEGPRAGALALHLGMSGQLLVVQPSTPDETLEDPRSNSRLQDPLGRDDSSPEEIAGLPHVRALWAIDDVGELLLLRDPRGFGRAHWASAGEMPAWLAARAAPDPFQVDEREFFERLSRGSRGVKPKLMDQSVLSGVGNIYADEALWAAGISPWATSLTRAQYDLLLTTLRGVLEEAIAAGGSTLRDFRSAHGESGKAQESHKCYGRAGLPCLRCSTLLVRSVQQGRSTVSCPECQPLPSRTTGKRRRS